MSRCQLREGQGWLGMIIGEDRTPTLRTPPIPSVDDFAVRVEDVRARAEKAGRDPATIDIICTGVWPLMDLRRNPNAEQMRDQAGRLAEIGTDWIVFNLCGDDPEESIDALEWVAAEVINS